MGFSRKFYGFLKLSDCYHASPDCPVLRHVVKRDAKVSMCEYTEESRAIASGHVRRCRLCLGDKVFNLQGTKDRVHLSDEQHSVLRFVVDIYNKRGPMTLRTISLRRKRSIVSTYLIIKRLRKDGLIEQKLKIGGQRASGRSIAPTKLGFAVIRTKAIQDWRNS